MRHQVTCVLLLGLCCNAIRVPNFFANNMILQRDMHLTFWGETNCSNVQVEVDGDVHETKTVVKKEWSITIPPHDAGTDKVIKFKDCESEVELRDVLFGDVFLCSGQSNMEFSLSQALDYKNIIQDSAKYKHFSFGNVKRIESSSLLFDVPTRHNNDTWWLRPSPQSFFNGDFSYPSAVCYLQAVKIYDYLNGSIPVGFLSTTWGGRMIQNFASVDLLRQCDPKANGDGILVGGMIAPFYRLKFKGILWYQGEANDFQPDMYKCLFPKFIEDWRKRFAQPDLPFSFVQLAGFSNENFVALREAQMSATPMKNVGYALSIDIGNFQDVHPREKTEVGRRLSLTMRNIAYNDNTVKYWTGPVAVEATKSNDNSVMIHLAHDAKSLSFRGTMNCTTCCKESPFQILVNGKWIRADANLSSSEYIVIQNGIGSTQVRYNYEGFPQCAIVNDYGAVNEGILPMTPFSLAIPQYDSNLMEIW